jgi:hypothetical protein
MHGAASPQAQRSARERLADLVDPSLEGLRKAIASGDHGHVVRAAVAVLDRAGLGPTSRVELSGIRTIELLPPKDGRT